MRIEDIHPGDHLVFRQWEDMEAEYGINEDTGSIACRCYFTKEMQGLCGREVVVQGINDGRIILEDDGAKIDDWTYTISADMLERPGDSVVGDFTPALMSLLGVSQ